ncbi:MAG: hypothetical protein IKP38_09990 [Clostridia bacterium]|nr:hypothetical protein [Clostridia bacterium]
MKKKKGKENMKRMISFMIIMMFFIACNTLPTTESGIKQDTMDASTETIVIIPASDVPSDTPVLIQVTSAPTFEASNEESCIETATPTYVMQTPEQTTSLNTPAQTPKETKTPTVTTTPTQEPQRTPNPTAKQTQKPTPMPTLKPSATPFVWTCIYCGMRFGSSDADYERWYEHAWINPGHYNEGSHDATPTPSHPVGEGHWETHWVEDVPAVYEYGYKCNHCGAKFPGNYYDNYVPLHLKPTMEESAKKHVCHIENPNTENVCVVCVCGYVWRCGDNYPYVTWGDQNDPGNASYVNLNHPYCEAHGGHISYSDLITPAEGHWETVWVPDP